MIATMTPEEIAGRTGTPGEFLRGPYLDPRPHHRRRFVRLPGRAGPLSPLRLAGLPLGAPRHHRAPPARAGRRDLHVGRRPDPRRARLGLSRGPGIRLDPVNGFHFLTEAYLPPTRRYTGPLHRALRLGPRDRAPRDQRLPRYHARFWRRPSANSSAPAPDLYPGALRAEIDEVNAVGLSRCQQRRLQGRLRHHAGGL